MKPSERISEIAQNKSFEKVRDLIPNGAIIAAILVYLDEQAESQEPKASEECCSHCDDKGEPGYTECKDCPCHQKETEPTINKPLWN